jgi:hypothetical protein
VYNPSFQEKPAFVNSQDSNQRKPVVRSTDREMQPLQMPTATLHAKAATDWQVY